MQSTSPDQLEWAKLDERRLVTVHLITSSKDLSTTFRELVESCKAVHLAVAWASTGFPESGALVGATRKIGRAVIGTHFYQTSPEFIEKFAGDERVRFVMDHSGIFHPKLYLFECRGTGWACIVGSANFTAGGFGRNQEACLLVTEADDPGGTVLANARTSLGRYWKNAVPGADIDLDRYREMRKRLARPLAHAAGQFGTGKPSPPVEDIDVLNMSWDEFISKVCRDRHHALDGRLNVLQAARDLFRQHGTLADMSVEDRQGIAGFREDNEIPWGWFGSMRGAGVFKNLVNEEPQGLSDALNQVPLDGQVTREDFTEFANRFVSAFPLKDGRRTRHGLSTATRLLAMKRPDYFACVDGANRRRLLKDFGIGLSNHDYVGYWDKIVERIQLASWWNARRPPEPTAGRVWDGRAAMLDAMYYAPTT